MSLSYRAASRVNHRAISHRDYLLHLYILDCFRIVTVVRGSIVIAVPLGERKTMKHVVSFAGLLLLPITLVLAKQPDVGATVQTSSGPVTGHAALNQTLVSEYLGIPYAQPPVGDLRFAPPQTYSSATPLSGSSYVGWLLTTSGDGNLEN